MFKPLEIELKKIKDEIKIQKEEDILKELQIQLPNEQLLNQMHKAVIADDKTT